MELPDNLLEIWVNNKKISRILDLQKYLQFKSIELSYNHLSEPNDINQLTEIDDIYVNIYGNPFCETIN
ncbi:MAG: hypothetical protein GF317_14065 [Candidatus Lokiarchaeota archaeon]|nr:hypothetical protein [Candidatus Lokiarchaeota archaeon]MBD3200742.1 hypothetical protein [Candidatus Lokiarchaeota archaeon]